MKTVLAFIISIIGFGALFFLIDVLLLNAQVLSIIFRG